MAKAKKKKIRIKWDNVFIASSSLLVIGSLFLNPIILIGSSAIFLSSIGNKMIKIEIKKFNDKNLDEIKENLKELDSVNHIFDDELEESNIMNITDYKNNLEYYSKIDKEEEKEETTVTDEYSIKYEPIIFDMLKFMKYKEEKNLDIKFNITKLDMFKYADLLYDELILNGCSSLYEKTIHDIYSSLVIKNIKNNSNEIIIQDFIDSLSRLELINFNYNVIEEMKLDFAHSFDYDNIINIHKTKELEKLKLNVNNSR